jgi:putative N6-adenine-specific DNA methylase
VTLRIKDAVCDAMRDLHGRRPSVDTSRPDVRVHAFLDARRWTMYLDTSGEALFKRGWRVSGG